jgi:alanine-glyoxylate transaminase / serine-glyoxylate transaminase / serine-pyruvate transaminase
MGHSSQAKNLTLVLSALETCLSDLGCKLKPGAAGKAADQVFSESGKPVMA